MNLQKKVEAMIAGFKKLTPRFWIITVSVLLILIRMFFPKLVFDQISLWLLIVCVVLIMIPNTVELADRITRFKKGDLEIEFDKKLDKLKKQTEEAERSIGMGLGLDFERIPENVKNRVLRVLSDPRAALVSLAIEIDSRLLELANKHKIKVRAGEIGAQEILRELVARKLVKPEVESAFESFRTIRNEAVHAREFAPNEQRLFELVELGMGVLRFLYAVPAGYHDLVGKTTVSCPKCGKDVQVEHTKDEGTEWFTAECKECGWHDKAVEYY